MNVLAWPYMADHTRLTTMFIRDGLGAPGDETGVGEASTDAGGHGSHPRQNRVAGEAPGQLTIK